VYLREELGSEVVIWDGVVGREVVALEAEGADPGGKVGIVVFVIFGIFLLVALA